MSGIFGERVRTLRKRYGLTVSELARRVEVSESAIRHIESGGTKHASLLVGLQLADLFGVTAWYLATGKERPAKTGARSEAELPQALEHLSIEVRAIKERLGSLEDEVRGESRRPRRPAG